MKYLKLRNKKIGDKDLEMRNTYRKQRLFEIQVQECEEDIMEEEHEHYIPEKEEKD